MSKAYQCDRCDAFGQHPPELILWTDEEGSPVRDGRYGTDLCGTCARAFEQFMSQPNTLG